ncbi:MAG: GMP/IMP nucleotidase [Promethearchaeota archaeon]
MYKIRDLNELQRNLWSEIEYILIDLDGTLLDRYFDDYFWEELVPQKYAQKHSFSIKQAQEILFKQYKAEEGTLNWTDVDYWSRDLNLDLYTLKKQIKHRIQVHPYVQEFLQALRDVNKTIFLLTNAHYKSLEIKMQETKLDTYFDAILTAFDVMLPKENLQFWEKAEQILKFDRNNSLFIDDSKTVLRAAKKYGIKYVLLQAKPSSKKPAIEQIETEFLQINNFKELLP